MNHSPIKLLYANGCSMTYGEELSSPDTEAYPIVFAQEVGIPEIKNDAIPGSSNEKIFRRTMDFISNYLEEGKNSEELMVLIGWTETARREFYNSVSKVWQSFNSKVPRHRPEDQKMQYAYFPNFVDENADYERMLKLIISLQNTLRVERIPFYFVNCLGCHDNVEANHSGLVRMIRPEFFMKSVNFHTWSMRRNYPLGSGNHPLEEAHREWGKFVAMNWKEL